MNASGAHIILTCGGTDYGFDAMTLTAACRIEDTPLTGGGHYRVRAAVNTDTLRLKGRVSFTDFAAYKSLVEYFGTGRRTFTLNGTQFAGWTLMSGKLTSAEGEPFAVCELILTEVSE